MLRAALSRLAFGLRWSPAMSAARSPLPQPHGSPIAPHRARSMLICDQQVYTPRNYMYDKINTLPPLV
ncbi:unnamed protein product [Urochloa humidicola]